MYMTTAKQLHCGVGSSVSIHQPQIPSNFGKLILRGIEYIYLYIFHMFNSYVYYFCLYFDRDLFGLEVT